jgi:hypothetical protein
VQGRLPWLLAAPLVAVGTLGGHVVGYRVALADSGEHTEVLATTGHGYLVALVALGLPFLRR